MTSGELELRVAQWEDLHTEFKLEAIHPDDLSAAIVGFANSVCGELIIGVSSERQIVGVGDTDRLAQYVDNVAFNNCKPPISTALEIVEYRRVCGWSDTRAGIEARHRDGGPTHYR